MKSQLMKRKEKGVVLLLILGLMAMFSMMVLAFMIVTSNMAESARLSAQIDEVAAPDPKSDLDTAISNLVIGSNNRLNPIAPFSILENLYGDDINLADTYNLNAVITPSIGLRAQDPLTLMASYNPAAPNANTRDQYIDLDLIVTLPNNNSRDDLKMLDQYERIGSVVTFGKIYNTNITPSYTVNLTADYNAQPGMVSDVFAEYWNKNIAGTSAIVIGKFMTDPTINYCNTWRIRIAPNEAFYRMIEYFGQGNWSLASTNNAVCQVKFNLPAFSGTGAGYFNPEDVDHGHDEQYYSVTNETTGLKYHKYRIPFYAYGNAAAPDLGKNNKLFNINLLSLTGNTVPNYGAKFDYINGCGVDVTPNVITAQTFWMHLKDGLYRSNVNTPVRMNPSYTAPDERSLFLAWLPYAGAENHDPYTTYKTLGLSPSVFGASGPNNAEYKAPSFVYTHNTAFGLLQRENWIGVIPSFLRPWKLHERYIAFQYDSDPLNNTSGNTYKSIFTNDSPVLDTMAVVRKLTPRPLPFDHWHFSGGNSNLDIELYPTAKTNLNSADVKDRNAVVREYLDPLRGQKLLQNESNYEYENIGWDVDNDNDGFREGIWLYSGLPIRYTPEGKPYATMFSYTVIDMDGKININTAGSWDQIPFRLNGTTTLLRPYQKLKDLITLKKEWSSDGTIQGWEDFSNPCYYFDNLKIGDSFQTAFGWRDDTNISDTDTSFKGKRGSGSGPAGLDLRSALEKLQLHTFLSKKIDMNDVGLSGNVQYLRSNDEELQLSNITANILWRRNNTDDNRTGSNLAEKIEWTKDILSKTETVSNLYQPGYGANDDVASRLYEFVETVALYSTENPENKLQSAFHYPNRGKMTIPYGGNRKVQAWKDDGRILVPFDFADQGLKSYDPLGHELYTYGTMLSDNPYRLLPNQQSVYDFPYSVSMFERIMRPSDSDSGTLPRETLYDLFNLWSLTTDNTTSDLSTLDNDYYAEYLLAKQTAINLITKIRHTLTPVSNDIPMISTAFPDRIKVEIKTAAVPPATEDTYAEPKFGPFEGDGGAYGIISLLRKCVYSEFAKNKIYDQTPLGEEIDHVLEGQVNKIALYLASLLPEEILAGQRIDLNKLTDKTYWQDLGWLNSSFVRNVTQTGFNNISVSDNQKMAHAYGLAKKMEYARGLYILLMAITWQDRNASLGTHDWEKNFEEELSDYTEGCFQESYLKNDLLKKLKGGTAPANQTVYKKEIQNELIANRIAQWCINLVDFSDVDATMTPFWFDSNPFDGWWNISDHPLGAHNVTTINNFIYTPLFRYDDNPKKNPQNTGSFSPKEKMLYFFTELLANPDNNVNASVFLNISTTNGGDFETPTVTYLPYKMLPDEVVPPNPTFAQYCRGWLMSENAIDTSATPVSKLEFRQVWGLERPDLVLTETLNFHDLGLADTEEEEGNNRYDKHKVSEGAIGTGTLFNYPKKKFDNTFDQVVRPEGSSYLELYSTANPNVPQSPELYDYVNVCDLGSHPLYFPDSSNSFTSKRTIKRWQLNLSKRTPGVSVQTNNGGEVNTVTIPFPVWRVAISAPATWGDGADVSKITQTPAPIVNTLTTYRKHSNSIAKRLTNTDEDSLLFSLQPKQFREFPNNWKIFDIPQSSILGPTYSMYKKSGNKRTYEDEIELDRYLWFGNYSDQNSNFTKYPDAKRIFHHYKETWTGSSGNPALASGSNVWLGANQYLVVGPENERSLGSLCYNSGGSNFGKPSANKISIRNYKYVVQGGTEKVSCTNSGIPDLKSQNFKYILAGALLDTNNSTKSRFNISEPLWKDATDPYAYIFGAFDFDLANSTGDSGGEKRNYPDEPYDMPKDWYNHNDGNKPKMTKENERPIADDFLFGIGTVPDYKSAFLQRVADPNRPYHPLMNPYITVDWNMMDLTVFNGESLENPIYGSGNLPKESNVTTAVPEWNYHYAFYNKKNDETFRIPFIKGTVDKPINAFGVRLTNLNDYPIELECSLENEPKNFDQQFSSRQWGRDEQSAFKPQNTSVSNPNPWARGFDLEKLKKEPTLTNHAHDGKFYGLEGWSFPRNNAGEKINNSSDLNKMAMIMYPTNTLGGFNDEEKVGFNAAYHVANTSTARGSVYLCSPAVPFEYLNWNDAPFSNTMEMTLCPSSNAGRFGLEFIRKNDNTKWHSNKLYNVSDSLTGNTGSTSLGSSAYHVTNKYAYYGYDYTASSNGHTSDRMMASPYFNFFDGSDLPGKALNLASFMEFFNVGTKYPSSYSYGGVEFAPVLANGNIQANQPAGSILYPKLREPGKININTMTESGLWGFNVDAQFNVVNGNRNERAFQSPWSGVLNRLGGKEKTTAIDYTILRKDTVTEGENKFAAFATNADRNVTTNGGRGNMSALTEDIQRIAGISTTRSNVFAAWITVGYFEAEKCLPGVNMPRYAPNGTDLNSFHASGNPYFVSNPEHQFYNYYKAIYPDGYTFGKELDINTGLSRKRGFYMIDRSIPVEFRKRGESSNWRDTLLLERVIN